MQLLADEERLLTEALLLDAVAVADGGAWTGAPTAEEQAAALAALARLQRQLEMSASLMDGYLRVVVALPLTGDAALMGVLEECCVALARCGLADDSDNGTKRMDECCDRWRKWLADVAAGRVQLVTPSGEVPPAPGGGRVRQGAARSGFDWSAHSTTRGGG